MKTKVFLLVTMLLCIINASYGQLKNDNRADTLSRLKAVQEENNLPVKLPSSIPPSPQAQSYMRYGEVPVSLFTGTPSIEIPLYTIECKGLSIPVTLSYHALGNKVEDVSSSVGLGWVLNAGGQISRNIKGLPDEHPNSILNNTPPQSFTSVDCYNSVHYDLAGSKNYEPDDFYFNFLGYSGSFSFGSDKKIYLNPYCDLLVESIYSPGNDLKFKVTTPEGHVCWFEELEKTTLYNGSSNLYNGYPTAWQLSKIVLANNGGTINLSYANAGYSIERKYAYEASVGPYFVKEILDYDFHGKPLWDIFQRNLKLEDPSYCILTQNALYVSEITFDNGRINFAYDNTRKDCSNGKALKTIRVYSGASGTDLVKQFDLYQSYTYNNAGYNPFANGTEYYRMMLDSVVQKSSSNQRGEVYSMDYDKTPFSPRKNCGVDLWGYCNGNVNNKTLVYLNDNQQSVTLNGFNYPITVGVRTADVTKMQAGILKKLVYPTGGYTAFDYEPHQFDRTRIVTSPQYIEARAVQDEQGNSPARVKEIYLDPANFVANSQDNLVRQATLQVKVGLDDGAYAIMEDLTVPSMMFKFTSGETKNVTIDLTKGHKYRLTAYIKPIGYDNDKNVYINLSWNQTQTKTVAYQEGGLRIKSIQNYDTNGTLAHAKYYKYGKNEDGKGRFNFFDYLLAMENTMLHNYAQSFTNPADGGFACVDRECQRMSILSQPVYTPGDFGKSIIGYEQVTEYEYGLSGLNGKTEYFYDLQMNGYIDDDEPYLYPDQARLLPDSWKSGQLLEKIEYKKTSTGFDPVRHTVNSYGTSSLVPVSFGYHIGEKQTYSGECLDSWMETHQTKDVYYILPIPKQASIKLLTKTIETQLNQGQSVSLTTDYQHNGLNLPQQPYSFVTSIETVGSDNKARRKSFKYPADYSTLSPYKEMVSNHLISPVIESSTTVDGKTVSAEKVSYKNWGANKFMPEIIYKGIDQSKLEARMTYYNYDSYCNPLYISKDAADQVIYLWSYNYQYPVAEIKGATFGEVKSALGYSDSQVEALSAKIPGDSEIDAIGNTLRSAFLSKPVLVTTYIYKPLVGMSSMTDPRGVKTTYQYDSFGRLSCTKDNDGKIIEAYDYHYQNQ